MMRDIFAETNAVRARDKQRWAEMDQDLCMMCGAYGADKRSLFIACLYAVNEEVPEAIDLMALKDIEPELAKRGFYLRTCKSCRARFLRHLGEWRSECLALRSSTKDHDGYLSEDDDSERNIPVRINGVTAMLTLEEFEARRAKDTQP